MDSSPDATWTGEEPAGPTQGASRPPQEGEQSERYRELREVGRGSIGQVALSDDQWLGRPVARKTLLDTPKARTTENKARFLKEARITAQLEHPGIVPVYDVGRDDEGDYFYTMRYVDGRTLKEALAAAKTLHERLALLPHFVDLCQAVAYAHHREIVHRDIKPANVVIGPFGETVLMDWGLAKHLGGPSSADTSAPFATHAAMTLETMAGTVIGTPAYMSPEQAFGQTDAVDRRSDVWSLGAMLYEILVGHPPFVGNGAMDVLSKLREGEWVPPRQAAPLAPPELAAVAARALQRDPDLRYPSAQALARDIEAWMTGGRVQAYDYGFVDLARWWVNRHRSRIAVAILLGTAVSATAAWGWRNTVNERDRAVAAEHSAQKALAESLAQRAVTMLHEGRGPEAALYAVEALRLDERSDARGALMGAQIDHFPVLVDSFAPPFDCSSAILVGDRYVCASEEQTAVFDAERRLVAQHPGGARSLSLMADGRLARFGADGHWDVLDLATGTVTPRDRLWYTYLNDQPTPVVDFIGLRVVGDHVVGGNGRGLLVWDMDGGDQINTVTDIGLDSRLVEVEACPGHADMLVVTQAGMLVWVDRQSLSPGLKARVVDSGMLDVEIDCRTRRLYIASLDRQILAVDPDTFAIIDRRETPTVLGDLRLSPDGQFLAGVTEHGALVAYDTRGLEPRLSLPLPSSRFTLDLGEGGRAYASSPPILGRDQPAAVLVYDLDPVVGGNQWTAGNGVTTVLVEPGTGRIASLDGDGGVAFHDPTGRMPSQVVTGTPRSTARSGAFLPDGRLIVGYSNDGGRIVDPSTLTVTGPAVEGATNGYFYRSVAVFAGTPTRTYSLSYSRGIVVWDGTELRSVFKQDIMDPGGDQATDFEVFAGQTRIALADDNLGAAVFSIPPGLPLGLYPGRFRSVGASADGTTLAWGGGDAEILVFDGLPGQVEPRRLVGHQGLVADLAFSPDGRWLVSGSWDTTVRVWDVRSGVERAQFPAHSQRVSTVTFSQDGKQFYSGSWDHTVRAWDTAVLDADPAVLGPLLSDRLGLRVDGASIVRVEPVP